MGEIERVTSKDFEARVDALVAVRDPAAGTIRDQVYETASDSWASTVAPFATIALLVMVLVIVGATGASDIPAGILAILVLIPAWGAVRHWRRLDEAVPGPSPTILVGSSLTVRWMFGYTVLVTILATGVLALGSLLLPVPGGMWSLLLIGFAYVLSNIVDEAVTRIQSARHGVEYATSMTAGGSEYFTFPPAEGEAAARAPAPATS